MAFLIQQIKEHKILDMEVNFEEYINENSVSEAAIIYNMIFDKEVFETEQEVREYVKDKYIWDVKITELPTSFIVDIANDTQLDLTTNITIELRRGVVASAADYIPTSSNREIAFNSKGVHSFVSKISNVVELNNGVPHIIEIAKVAKGYHPSYGEIEVNQDHLESFVKNYNLSVTDVDLAVNEDHEKKEAFGWYKDVWLSQDKQTLYGSIMWNTKGSQALSEKDYRYFSPEFHFNYVHELKGTEHGPTLLGGALTNYPFLKMNAIVEMNNKKTLTKEKIVSKETQIDLSVHNQAVVDLNSKISGLQIELNSKIAENTQVKEELNVLKQTIELNAKKAAHQTLFDNGHVNAAQLVALNEGKTMLEVLSLNAKRNTEAKGADGNPINDTVELNAVDKKIAEQMGLTEEAYKAIEL